MLDELDEALRELLTRDMPINNNEVDIAFEQPTRDWASRLSRPTLNLFMHDVRENNKLRTQQPYLGNSSNAGYTASVGPAPVRLDVHYMVTTWANDPGDEHRLLGRTLMVLYRYSTLPNDLESELLFHEDYEILIKIAQYDQRDTRREIWNMLDNEMRPIIDLTLTVNIKPLSEWTVPLVRQTQIGFGQMAPNANGFGMGDNGVGDNGTSFTSGLTGVDRFHYVSGTIHSPFPLDSIGVQLMEIAIPVTVTPDGRYLIQNLRKGTYTLEVWAGERDEPIHHTIEVPSPPAEYDIYLS